MGKTFRKGISNLRNIEKTYPTKKTLNSNDNNNNNNSCKCTELTYSKVGNIPNMEHKYFNDESLNKNYNYKWSSNEISPLDSINTIINEGNKNDKYLKSCKKQMERRGKFEQFIGHRN